jgi:uncharacterized protein (DUF58 family)
MDRELFKKIRRIHFQTTRLATDLLAGFYRSAFKGKGIEFEEVREFQDGDEVRYIDWNVTARMNHPFVKIFREERELPVMLLVDASASCHFGKKNEFIAEIGGVLAYSAIKNNDRIGLILFTDQVEKYIPPRKGTRHILRLIRELLLFKPKSRGTNIASALTFYGHMQKQTGICFLISDFIDLNFERQIKILAKKHDLICIHTTDPLEQNLPSAGLVEMRDLETGERKLIDTSDEHIRKHQREVFLKRKRALKEIASKTEAGIIEVSTDKPYVTTLYKFFKQREMK